MSTSTISRRVRIYSVGTGFILENIYTYFCSEFGIPSCWTINHKCHTYGKIDATQQESLVQGSIVRKISEDSLLEVNFLRKVLIVYMVFTISYKTC